MLACGALRPDWRRFLADLAPGAVAGLAWNASSGRGFALGQQRASSRPGTSSSRPPRPRSCLDKGRALPRRAARATSGEMDHIPGALPLPEDDFDRAFAERRAAAASRQGDRRLLQRLRLRGEPRRRARGCASGAFDAGDPRRGAAGVAGRRATRRQRGARRELPALPPAPPGSPPAARRRSSSTRASTRSRARPPSPGSSTSGRSAGPVLSNLVAVTLPWIELLAGALLIARRVEARVGARRSRSCSSSSSWPPASVLARGIDVENCGCTSLARTEADRPSWPPPWTKGVGWFLVTRNRPDARRGPPDRAAPPRREPRRPRPSPSAARPESA